MYKVDTQKHTQNSKKERNSHILLVGPKKLNEYFIKLYVNILKSNVL